MEYKFNRIDLYILFNMVVFIGFFWFVLSRDVYMFLVWDFVVVIIILEYWWLGMRKIEFWCSMDKYKYIVYFEKIYGVIV